ncbi:MAG: hypothetical protein R3B47_14150 [Bacteroidia bacterium]
MGQAEELLNGKRHSLGLESGELVFGEIQDSYNQLVKAINDYVTIRQNSNFNQNIAALQAQVSHYKKLESISNNLLDLGEEELQIANQKFTTQKNPV